MLPGYDCATKVVYDPESQHLYQLQPRLGYAPRIRAQPGQRFSPGWLGLPDRPIRQRLPAGRVAMVDGKPELGFN